MRRGLDSLAHLALRLGAALARLLAGSVRHGAPSAVALKRTAIMACSASSSPSKAARARASRPRPGSRRAAVAGRHRHAGDARAGRLALRRGAAHGHPRPRDAAALGALGSAAVLCRARRSPRQDHPPALNAGPVGDLRPLLRFDARLSGRGRRPAGRGHRRARRDGRRRRRARISPSSSIFPPSWGSGARWAGACTRPIPTPSPTPTKSATWPFTGSCARRFARSPAPSRERCVLIDATHGRGRRVRRRLAGRAGAPAGRGRADGARARHRRDRGAAGGRPARRLSASARDAASCSATRRPSARSPRRSAAAACITPGCSPGRRASARRRSPTASRAPRSRRPSERDAIGAEPRGRRRHERRAARCARCRIRACSSCAAPTT